MKIYTIGFTQKTAEQFFESLKNNSINALIDVRLNNKSQLAGFAKGKDLEYFLKEICDAHYFYEEAFAPTKELLDDWKKGKIEWFEYEYLYRKIIFKRKAQEIFMDNYYKSDRDYSVCFLCSENTTENCHRRLLAEYLKEFCPELKDVEIIHI